MLTILWLAAVLACGYGAYRAVRGGFERRQPEKPGFYGVVGCLVLLLLAASLVTHLFG